MRARANEDRLTGKDVAALAVVVAVVCWILYLLGPAIDREIALQDAKIEAHKASLVAQQ